ncbi:HEAT repeat-containing protein 4-like isoform X2 [Lineus longissimus]|uniref:HEAT repeat-containing protein 4-like isoform X2 n=1 Tax=Lineus longissimus TaxID=88925 RepID=UPI002B4C4559
MENLKHPQLFPCASRVQIPHVGADERDYHDATVLPEVIRLKGRRFHADVTDGYLKNVSESLAFDEDVVRDRCFHLLPYSDKYFLEAVDPSSVVKPRPKPTGPTGRCDKRGTDNRHMPCHIKKTVAHKLKPMRRRIMERAVQMHKDAMLKEFQESVEQVEDTIVKPSAFLTEVKDAVQLTKKKPKRKVDWDDVLISRLSRNTAQWLVHHKMSPYDPKYQKFERLLHDWYGEATNTELVRDSVSEADFALPKKKDEKTKADEKSPWKAKKEQELLEQIRMQARDSDRPTDPYSDDTSAAFYRLPTGIRKQQKYKDKVEAAWGRGAINKTAHAIEVKPRQFSPPPTLRDHMNEHIGDKALDTDNLFQQERLTGKNQIHNLDGPDDIILMETNNKYRKHLQQQYPQEPEGWYSEGEDDKKIDAKKKDEKKGGKRIEKGLHRWRELPELIDESADVLYKLGPGNEIDYQKISDPSTRKKARSNLSLVKIIDDWRGKWFLNQRFADATTSDLIRDMGDIHSHIRLKAIMTVARAADYRPPPEMGINLEKTDEIDFIEQLPDRLVKAIRCLLTDDHPRVRLAAAITLFTIKKPHPKAEELLRTALRSNSTVDRWAASQCLAHCGVCDSEVAGELINQLMTSEDAIRHEQATHLLALLSQDIANSQLVYSMLAEQLNSSSWRHKVIACKAIPVLNGTINKDIAHKLAEVMWYDWHGEVKKAAAQCLGKTGHGKEVHDDLQERIIKGGERVRADAIGRLGHLGIMTAKLLPIFLRCFEDSYVSVREQCCITCSNLKIKDDAVLSKLVDLASFDPIWKVKALALQALGKIDVLNDEIRECLLWALRYETEAAVRAEACHAITALDMREEETAEILQERYLVECSQLVKEEITEALKMFDISPTEDMDTVAQIKEEVRKLCTRNNICAQITTNEQNEEHEENLKRLIHRPKSGEKKDDSQSATATSGSTGSTGSPSYKVRSAGSRTPESIREGNVFTPTAENELEAILEKDETIESEPSKSPMSPLDVDEPEVFGRETRSRETKSRPLTTSTEMTISETPTDGADYSDSESLYRPFSGVSTSGKSHDSDQQVDPDRQSSKLQFVQSYIEAGTPGGFGRRSRFLSSLTPRGSTRERNTPKKTVLHFRYDMENVDSLVGIDLSDPNAPQKTPTPTKAGKPAMIDRSLPRFDPGAADEIVQVDSEGSSVPSSVDDPSEVIAEPQNDIDELIADVVLRAVESLQDSNAASEDMNAGEKSELEQIQFDQQTRALETESNEASELKSDEKPSETMDAPPSDTKMDGNSDTGSAVEVGDENGTLVEGIGEGMSQSDGDACLSESKKDRESTRRVPERLKSEITVILEDTEGKTDIIV